MLHTVTRLLDKEILECDKDGHLVDYVVKQMQNEIANPVICVIKEKIDLKKFGELEPGELFIVDHKPYIKIDLRFMPKLCCNCAFGGDNPDFILAVNLRNGAIETFARDCGTRKVVDYNLDITI